MRTRLFKIKRKTTKQFWTGYVDRFADTGVEFVSQDAAVYALARQRRDHRIACGSWLSDAIVVEYNVTTTEIASVEVDLLLSRKVQMDDLAVRYGFAFVKNLKKVNNHLSVNKYKYAMFVTHDVFQAFREGLKDLGYSSRHYKKTDSWLWTNDEQVALRSRLLKQVSIFVDLEKEIPDAVSVQASSPANDDVL